MKRFTCLAGILLLFVSSPVSRSQDASREGYPGGEEN